MRIDLLESLYVIAKSDSVEHLYWDDFGNWGDLSEACMYTRDYVTNNREPEGGFWMPLERAQELEQ